MDAKPPPASGTYAWYVVFLCMVAYVFSFIDRQILALLIQPIRKDLDISDTQFSLLHGLAFSIFYATMGIPIARLADTIREATRVQKPRKPTRPSKTAKKKRLDAKSRRSDIKRLRGKPPAD